MKLDCFFEITEKRIGTAKVVIYSSFLIFPENLEDKEKIKSGQED